MSILVRNVFRRRSASQTQDADAGLRALIDGNAAAAYRVALSIVRDPSLAEDVVQETMIRVWRSHETLRDPAAERAWVLRITHNVAVSALRRVRDEATDPHDMPDTASLSADRHAEGRADLIKLRQALDSLDELTRSILVLRDVEGLPYAMIAETLGTSIPLVKTRLLRGRRELHRQVETEAFT